MLHRLAEAEIYAEGERRDEFRQPNMGTINLGGQRRRLLRHPALRDGFQGAATSQGADAQGIPISELSPTMKR